MGNISGVRGIGIGDWNWGLGTGIGGLGDLES